MPTLFEKSPPYKVNGRRFVEGGSDIIGGVWCVWCGKYTGNNFEKHHVFPKEYYKELAACFEKANKKLIKGNYNHTTSILFSLINITIKCWDNSWTVPVCNERCHSAFQKSSNTLGSNISSLIFHDIFTSCPPNLNKNTHDIHSIAHRCFEKGLTNISAFLTLCAAYSDSITNPKVSNWIKPWLLSISTLKDSDILAIEFYRLCQDTNYKLTYDDQNNLVNALLHGDQEAKLIAQKIYKDIYHKRGCEPIVLAGSGRRRAMLSQELDDIKKSTALTKKAGIPYSNNTARLIECLYFIYNDHQTVIELTSFVLGESKSYYQNIEATVFSAAATYFQIKQKGMFLSEERLFILLERLYRAEALSAIYRLQSISLIDRSNENTVIPLTPLDLINSILADKRANSMLGNNPIKKLEEIRTSALCSIRKEVYEVFGSVIVPL